MTAFSDAFFILKNEHQFDLLIDSVLLKGKAEEAIELQQMRQFVLDNHQHPDPAKAQASEEMYQHLMKIMSAQSGTAPMQPPEGPVGQGAEAADMSQPPQPPEHPMMKAWANLKKQVIGMQDGQEYKQPDAISSMAQRPTEQLNQNMGQPSVTGPQTMNVQGNMPHPMGDSYGVGQAPGAEVTRMPAPHPYEADDRFESKYGKQGPATPTSHTPNFQNMNDPTVMGETRPINIRQDRYPERGGAYPREVGDESAYYYQQGKSPENAQRNRGDQFNPNRDMSFQSGDKYEPGYDSMKIDGNQ